ncbi:MAG: polyprenyl synthetase family protein [Nitrospira sp.]|nr:polyprenyl synthetase family protein [Nitrospira sp.]
MEGALTVADERTREVVQLLISRGGKRLRPALLLLSARYGNGNEEQLLKAAAGLELIHVASLYHDDVMDRAMTRRAAATANGSWGNSVATMGGVFLFAKAISLISSLGSSANQITGTATCRLCAGQLREAENAFNVDITVDEHLEILNLKTATLFELPCQLGMLLSPCNPEQATALTCYGNRLGLAFQLVDDALDWEGDKESLGKTPLSDIREGVYSLPVIHVLESSGSQSQRLRSLLIQRRLSEADVLEIKRIVHDSGGVSVALEKARELVMDAKKQVSILPAGFPLTSLRALADFCLTRTN